MAKHHYGGAHSDVKIEALKEYLQGFQKVLERSASQFGWKTVYIDLFAGTGFRDVPIPEAPLLPDDMPMQENESAMRFPGSASVALDLDKPFDLYYFVEKKVKHASSLEALTAPKGSEKKVYQGDANTQVYDIISDLNKIRDYRGVVFLDPYDMSVDYDTVAALANTGKIDIWYLLHLSGIERNIGENASHAHPKYEKALGISNIRDAMEKFMDSTSESEPLFEYAQSLDEQSAQAKRDAFERLFHSRLGAIKGQKHVLPFSLRLQSKASMFSLCFYVSNEKALEIATRLAKGVMTKIAREQPNIAEIKKVVV